MVQDMGGGGGDAGDALRGVDVSSTHQWAEQGESTVNPSALAGHAFSTLP